MTDIAIVSLVSRFPGAPNPEGLWANLRSGRESISFFTRDELLAAGIPRRTAEHPHYIPARGVYERPLAFDARFFGYSPRESELLDPQHRIFLECCWEALELAGCDPFDTPLRVGVFGGCGMNRHRGRLAVHPVHKRATPISVTVSNDVDYLCTRVGHKLNLRGPCVSVQTACSTALVSVVLASRSLLAHECDLGLAGAVSVHPDSVSGYWYAKEGLLSPDGHCRSFDAAALGTVFSSGAGMVALKRLPDAIASRDHIYAVLKGYSLTNDAAGRAYFTAAGVAGQESAVRQAIEMSGVGDTISYVECHGTGTSVGDPIELKALTSAFRTFGNRTRYCAIGSIKANIGHTDTAAGVAGLAKVLLALQHRQLPPSINFEKLPSHVSLADTPFFVNTTLTGWRSDGPLRAGVSSFGMGGTNAHVVLEEAPTVERQAVTEQPHLIVWSARTESALQTATAALAQQLTGRPDLRLGDVGFTLASRHRFERRRWTICSSREDLLRALADGRYHESVAPPRRSPPRMVLIIGDGGSDHDAIKKLHAEDPAFRSAYEEGVGTLLARSGVDLRERMSLASDQDSTDEPTFRLLTSYAMAKMWLARGVMPDAVTGLRIGKLVAAMVAGVLSIDDAATVVRGWGAVGHTASGTRGAVTIHPPTLPVLSPGGQRLTVGDFEQALEEDDVWHIDADALLSAGYTTALHIGMAQTLRPAAEGATGNGAGWAIDGGCQGASGDDLRHWLLAVVGTLWGRGLPVSLARWLMDHDVRRVLLPTYPFEREDYGLSRAEYQALLNGEGEVAPSLAAAVWRVTWQRTSPDAVAANQGPWWLFAEAESERHAPWLAQLVQHDVIRVEPGASRHFGPDHFIVGRGVAADYEAMFDPLLALGRLPTQVIYVGSSRDLRTDAGRRYLQDFVLLLNATARRLPEHPLVVTVIGTGAFDVIGSDQSNPGALEPLAAREQLPSLPQTWRWRFIDVGATAHDSRLLPRELQSDPRDSVVCLRGPHRWVRRLDQQGSMDTKTPSNGRLSGGTYVLIGGCTPTGLSFANALATTGRVRLVLVDALAAIGDTPSAIAMPRAGDSAVAEELRRLRHINEGGEISVMPAPASGVGWTRVFSDISTQFRTVDGVIDASELAEPDGGARDLDCLRAYAVALKDAIDTWHAEWLIACVPLRSLAPGTASAALIRTSALEYYLRPAAAEYVSIFVGVDAAADEPARHAGVEYCLRQLDGGGAQHWILSTRPPEEWASAPRSAVATPARLRPRPLTTDYLAPRNEVESAIAHTFECLLGVGPIGADDDFLALGGHSLLAIQCASRLTETFGCEWSASEVMQQSTPIKLADVLVEKLTRHLGAASIEGAQ